MSLIYFAKTVKTNLGSEDMTKECIQCDVDMSRWAERGYARCPRCTLARKIAIERRTRELARAYARARRVLK